jgi:hypothetical protein
MPTSREAFETWRAMHGNDLFSYRKWQPSHWSAWQSAYRAGQEAMREGASKALDEIIRDAYSYDGDAVSPGDLVRALPIED